MMEIYINRDPDKIHKQQHKHPEHGYFPKKYHSVDHEKQICLSIITNCNEKQHPTLNSKENQWMETEITK